MKYIRRHFAHGFNAGLIDIFSTVLPAALLSTLIPLAADAQAAQTERSLIPLDISSGLVTVPVKIRGYEAKAILDTGANVNAIDGSHASLVKRSGETKNLNFSDRGGIKAQIGNADFEIGTLWYPSEVVVTKTKVTKDCCDAILGKPFFDQNKVLIDFDAQTVELNPEKLPPGKSYALPLKNGAKEILLSCTVNGQKTEGRIDLGSQQALDVTGELAAKLKLFEKPETVFLDSMLQPGLAVSKAQISCGNLPIPREVPALLHPVSQSGLGHGEVGVNIGAPLLKRYKVLIDLPGAKLTLFEAPPVKPVAFNSLYVFFTTGALGEVVVKSVQAGSAGDDLGLKVGDKVLKINDADIHSPEQAYAKVEEKPVQKITMQIERAGAPLTLKGEIKSLLPRKVPWAQSPYGISEPLAVQASPLTSAAFAPPKLQPETIKAVRFRYENIEADFSLSRLLEGMSVRELLFERFKSAVTSSAKELYFEGLKVSADGKIAMDLSKSHPSVSFNCKDGNAGKPGKAGKKLTGSVDAKWLSASVFHATQTLQGCDQTIKLHATYQLETQAPAEPSESASPEPFLFLQDKLTGKTARWNRAELILTLDSRAPAWAQDALEAAAKSYNEVLGTKLTLKVVRGDLASTLIADAGVIGIYWTDSGHPFDRETRFAQTLITPDSQSGEILDADLVMRAPEFLQHENLVWQIANEAAARSAPADRSKFEEFAKTKISDMRKNVMIHELGHILGLAHNFSDTEKSVMSYATITALADYDRAALRYLYLGEKPPRTYHLQTKPGAAQGAGFD